MSEFLKQFPKPEDSESIFEWLFVKTGWLASQKWIFKLGGDRDYFGDIKDKINDEISAIEKENGKG